MNNPLTFLRAISIDYEEMKQFGERVKQFWNGNEFRVETRAGTDLTMLRVTGNRRFLLMGKL